MVRSLLNILFLVISSCLPVFLQGQTFNTYNLVIRKDNPLRVYVTAELEYADTLRMNPNCPNYDYPEGWSSFIHNLKVVQGKKQLTPRYVHKSKWALSGEEKKISLSYEVDLSFATEKWEVGNEQAGFFDGEAVFLVSKALFIHNGMDKAYTVNFFMDESWQLSVPWNLEGKSNTYFVPNPQHLLENSLVYGRHYRASQKVGNFDFEIALLGEAKESGVLFSSVLHKIANEFIHIFPSTPDTRYLVTMFYSDVDDGESFYTSNAFSSKRKIDERGKIVWANQMAHELFHYWNSDLIRTANYADSQWFSEGSAEYYANITLLRTGIIDEPTFRRKMEKILGLYNYYKGWTNTELSLREAGKSKGRNRFAVYNGGWAIAFALDLIILENTNGKKNLDDFMDLMLEKYSEDTYTFDDLVATASAVAERDVTEFFNRYVEGKELLPLDDYLKKVGYVSYDVIYEGEMYLEMENNSPHLRSLWLAR